MSEYSCPGERITETAIYQAIHRRHSLPEQILFFAEEEFPSCTVCGENVRYRLLRRPEVSFSSNVNDTNERKARKAGSSGISETPDL
jgi:hypothetical protein